MSASKPRVTLDRYAPSGYPENNKTFTREAAKLLKERKADVKKVETYFNEMSRLLEKKFSK